MSPSTKVFPLTSASAKEKKAADGSVLERLVTGYISTEGVDMDGDVVLASGVNTKSYFDTTRSVNLDHQPTEVVGTNRELAIRPGRGLYGLTYVGKSALAEDVFTMVLEGIIRGFSIEWDPRTLVSGPPTDAEKAANPGVVRVFRMWTLLGYAFTARPCNPRAVIDGVKSKTDPMEQVWSKTEALLSSGKIHLSSAKAAGFPVGPKAVAVTTPKPRTAVIVGGRVWTKAS